MPRVLLTGFCAVPGPRRAGVQLRHVIRALTPMHTVDLLVVREGDQAYVERQGSVRVLRVPTPEADLKAQIQSFQRALRRQLEGADYDVVHCRDPWSGLTVLEARQRLGFAVVYDLTRAPLGEAALDPDLEAQYNRDEEACMLAADLVLVPTPTAAKAMNRGRPDRVFVAPPGVDVDRFDWDDPPKGGPPRIVYTGSIDPGRGVRVLIRAMATIVREVEAKLVIAGAMVSPRFEAALREGIRELGLQANVELLGTVDHDQIPALLATATVCVVPAASDLSPNPMVTYPTKLLEYMACKRPIVAPKRETVSLVVEHNREALLFEAGDPIDLARKVLRLLGEPQLAARLASNAYERVRRDFTASATRRALRSAYAVIADRFDQDIEVDAEDAPKVELLTDDEFEATVFEEAPLAPPAVDTALNRIDPQAIDSLVARDATSSSSEQLAAPPRPETTTSQEHAPDDTLDRIPVAPPHRADSLAWTQSVVTAPPPPAGDDWVVTNVAAAVRAIEHEVDSAAVIQEVDTGSVMQPPVDDGTPADGSPQAVSIVTPQAENAFVAGEIDVPTPAPKFTAASELLGNAEPGTSNPDPDTGSRTPPPIVHARRNP